MLAVTTLGFALAANAWLFSQTWMLDIGANTRRPVLFGVPLNTTKRYYFVALLILLVGFWLARNIWRGGLGRRLRAVRDNEDAARAFTIPATRVKLQGFVVSGFLAGLGGAVYGHFLSRISGPTFEVTASISVAALVVVGGMGVLAAPLLGALYIIGIPQFLPLDSAGLAATSVGWLILVINYPGGLAQAVGPIRDRAADWFARRAGLDPSVERADLSGASVKMAVPTITLPTATTRTDQGPILEAAGLIKRFGGLTAVNNVSLSIMQGETVGLLGPNGAGKTTLFELLGGFTRPDEGSITFAGTDVSALLPEKRAQLGLIRSFQDAGLFPTMSVTDAVMLSLERRDPTRLAPALLGATKSERRKLVRALELIDAVGLHSYRNHQIRQLSTGTRRVVELSCLMALEPTLLLLDEPTSGIAQRETEALGGVLQRMKEQLGLTLVIIEHDVPLIMSMSDRIIAMDAGQVIAVGDPEKVANDPLVVDAYLGTDKLAIERSGPRPTGKRS
jgi:ABC-type branched-subunit amino acid transport system ATPase component